MSETAERPRHLFRRAEYDLMVETGALSPEAKVELIEGEILEMSPEGPAHAAMIEGVAEELRAAFGAGFVVRVGHPLAASTDSEPEPDVAVVRGGWRDHLTAHPAWAELLVEVAWSSLGFDRVRKARLYAGAGIPEYWIVNLADRVLEAHTDPSGGVYCTVRHLGVQDSISPLGAGGASIPVAALLP